jgi:CelD/BcsL family acetyltransferase involved in cellulose biosynthesis
MIEVRSDIGTLVDEWWELWRRDSAATPFQSPAWLIPWARQFDGGESRVLIIRRGTTLAGLLPMFRHQDRLLPWGAGTSDWLDGIFDPELSPCELTEALSALDEALDLFQLRPDSALVSAPAPDGWTDRRATSEPCVRMSLPPRLPWNMRQNLRYYRARATAARVEEAQRVGVKAFEQLIDLHSRRWRRRQGKGVLADPRVLAWHRESLPALEAAGLLRLYALLRDDDAVAILYVLHAKQRAFYYIGGFEPELEHLGLGTILVGHAISEAAREGACEFDFLRGQEAYKYRWGATDQPTSARLLTPPER